MERRHLEDGQIAELLLVAGNGPATLGDELLGALVNLRLSSGDLVNGEVSEWPGILDVLQGLLEIAQLLVDNSLSLLCALDGLGLESLNGLDLPSYIVCLRLESVELLLDVVDNGLVLEDAAVVVEVDGLGLLGEDGDFATRIVVALLEGLEGSSGLTLEAELGAQLGPVELEGCATSDGHCDGFRRGLAIAADVDVVKVLS